MKRLFAYVAVLLCLMTDPVTATTWTSNIATSIVNTAIAPGASAELILYYGTISTTGDTTTDSAVITGIPDTSDLYFGLAVSGYGTIASVDSATQITTTDAATEDEDDAELSISASYSYAHLQVTVVEGASTNGATIKLYSSSDGTNFDTEPFATETITHVESQMVRWSYSIRVTDRPNIKVEIAQPSGGSGNITATVKLATR